MKEHTITPDEAGARLDKFVQKQYESLSFILAQKWIRTGKVKVGGKKKPHDYRLVLGDTVFLPDISLPDKYTPNKAKAPKWDLSKYILHETKDWLVLNKPQGLAVQGGSKVEYAIDAWVYGPQNKVYLVHRLDKDTSGILLLAKTAQMAKTLSHKFQTRDMEKTYLALTINMPELKRGTINLPLGKDTKHNQEKICIDEYGGQKAVTHYEVLDHLKQEISLIALYPQTGRKHQLRVHLNAIGCPIMGDGKYGGKLAHQLDHLCQKTLHLHAYKLAWDHYTFTAPLPPHFIKSMEALGMKIYEQ